MKGDHKVVVMLNSSLNDETVQMARFSDITGGYTKGRDVITGDTVNINRPVVVPGKGELVLELVK